MPETANETWLTHKLRSLKPKGKVSSKPPCVALTGSMASGKSTALKAFQALGWRTLSADELVHEIYRERGIDMEKLREEVRDKPAVLKKLEASIHPEVRRRIRQEMKKRTRKPLMVEIPLLFESKNSMAREFDFNLMIFSPTAERKKRAISKRKIKPALFKVLDSRQLSGLEKAKRSDFCLYNFEKSSLRNQIRQLSKVLQA